MARYVLVGHVGWKPLEAFARGLQRLGHRTQTHDHWDWTGKGEGAEAVVIYGLRAQGRDIFHHYRRRGLPVVVIDHGYMRRVNTVDDFDVGHFQVGINRLGWVAPHSPSPDRFEALEVEIKAPRQGPIRKALICGQVEFDASHHLSADQLTDLYQRLERRLSDQGLSVTYRGHPQANFRPALLHDGVRPLREALSETDAVFCVNSNAGLDAIIDGLPVGVLGRSHYTALAYRMPFAASRMLPPSTGQVRAHLERLAWSQWTLEEIEAGLPQRFLAEIGEIP